MTDNNLVKLYNHFCFLASGKFKERDFDIEIKAEDPENSGHSHMGKMSPQRIALIISDAITHKEDMELKYPKLKELNKTVEKPKEDTPKNGKITPKNGKEEVKE